VSIDGCVSGGSCQVLSLPVRNVFSVSLDISLSQSKIKNKNFVTGFVQTYTEVIRLNVSMNKVTIVNVLNSLDHLVDQH
jgi:hypothetical protein